MKVTKVQFLGCMQPHKPKNCCAQSMDCIHFNVLCMQLKGFKSFFSASNCETGDSNHQSNQDEEPTQEPAPIS